MNLLVDKNISQSQVSPFRQIQDDEQSNDGNKHTFYIVHRLTRWLNSIKGSKRESLSKGRLLFGGNLKNNKNEEVMCISDIPFVIPRRLEDFHQETTTSENFERARLIIRRMDENLVTPEDLDQAKQQSHQDTNLGLQALALATISMQKVSFNEILSADENLATTARRLSLTTSNADNASLYTSEKADPITDFQEAHDLIEFEEALSEHHDNLSQTEPNKLSDMLYLKCCLMLELQRDENDSCLRIVLHDIIFKFHLSNFRLRCEMHLRKPIERELLLEKVLHDSHLSTNYSAQFILSSGDWIAQHEVELYLVMRIEPLSINKYIGPKFWDITHLHVKNVPHGASKIFLRELTPVSRPPKILSRGINVGQIEIEVAHWPDKSELSINIIKVSHSQAERLLGKPETFVEVIFQGPFDIYEIKRTKVADRSSNPVFNEEFFFKIPKKTAISDTTIDLLFFEKLSISHPIILGTVTLSKHTDWFPVRRFWAQLADSSNIKIKASFLFQGNVEE